MNLSELVLQYYKKENNNSCAEAMLKGCNEYYKLNLPEQCFLAASGFSKGMYGGHVCGAVASGAAVISILTSNGHAHDSEEMKILVSKLNKEVINRLSSNKCVELYGLYHTKEERCSKIVEEVSAVLQEILDKQIIK